MKKAIIIGTISVLALGGVSAAVILQPEEIKLESAQKIVWDKPTTDAEWAEDVKAENFDIKSTGVLETMVESHALKLAKNEKAFEKYQNCPDCIYWEKYYMFGNMYPEMDKSELEAEARLATDTDTHQRLWEIEKIKQSIERMHKEIELRDKGFVVVEGEDPKGKLGGVSSVPPERIRHIND